MTILVVSEPPGYEEKIVAEDPDRDTIDRTVKGLKWSEITFVRLRMDEQNWIEGSGSLDPGDGLSAKVAIDGKEQVSQRPPQSLDEIVWLLESYRSGDGRWRHMIEWD